jgi:hypothetical protein
MASVGFDAATKGDRRRLELRETRDGPGAKHTGKQACQSKRCCGLHLGARNAAHAHLERESRMLKREIGLVLRTETEV